MVKLLFADDHEAIRRMVQQLLTRHIPHCVVTTVADGEAAIGVVRQTAFDMVILDTLMPPERFGGIWAGQEIKRLRPETPLIFLSSYTQGQDIESVRQAGGMVLVNKELFAIPALIQAIFKAIWDWSLLRSLANERNIWFFEENLPLASGELVRMPVNRRERPV